MLLKVALQGFIVTLIYLLVTHINNRCKVATHNDGYGNAYMCLNKPSANYLYGLFTTTKQTFGRSAKWAIVSEKYASGTKKKLFSPGW
jgi:hypothetical protein